MIETHDIIFRIALITIIAGLVGIEREHLGKAAGLRTNILVGIGSALVMILALKLQETLPGTTIDPGRIAGQVVTGIGFLGAGAIIRDRAGVHGLTTAASIWVIAAIGLAVGMGFYLAAIVTSFVTLVTLYVLGRLEHHGSSIEINHNQESNNKDDESPL